MSSTAISVVTSGMFLLSVLVPRACYAQSNGGDGNASQPAMLITGGDSAVAETKLERIRSAEEWQEVWCAHNGQTVTGAFQANAPRLEIDFTTYEVIAIFQGAGINSRGITVESITESEDALLLRFDEWHYQSGIGGPDAATAYGFVVIHRTDKSVTVEENVQGLKGAEAKWKLQATLSVSGE